tara:strand:- start:1903 stop:2346 length:444 start_codon:yes stop_codon:yes gene_type:complete
MIKANVILDNKKWQKYIKNPSIYIKNKLNKLSKFKDFKKQKEFSIMLTDNKNMKNLNKKFRKKNMPTDVLSFPINNLLKNKKYIGDIAISFEIVNKRSKNSNFFIEFDKMWIHGYLHLIGYDHKSNSDFYKMNRKEVLILNYFKKKV